MARSSIPLGSALKPCPRRGVSSGFSTGDRSGSTHRNAGRRDLCAGKITSKALTSAALARAKAKSELNAFITLDEAGAMKAAEAFDAGRKKGSCKPLGGVPVVIKDNIEVAGLPASAGTPALKGFVPKKDAPVAAKLRAAGAIISADQHAWLPSDLGCTTPRSRQGEYGYATPGPTKIDGVRHRERALRSARGSSRRAPAPTPAARQGALRAERLRALRPTVGR